MMAIPDVVLPPYPNGQGHISAVRLKARRQQYAAAISALRKELAAVEDAFTGSFAEADERETTRARLLNLANTNRQRARRG
jgi:hypothetical protein